VLVETDESLSFQQIAVLASSILPGPALCTESPQTHRRLGDVAALGEVREAVRLSQEGSSTQFLTRIGGHKP